MIQLNPDKLPKQQIQQTIDARNNRSDPELGNLSPNQVHKLINLPWNDPDFPIKFNQQLKMSDLKYSTFLTNVTNIIL
jgi:hypothetical protein